MISVKKKHRRHIKENSYCLARSHARLKHIVCLFNVIFMWEYNIATRSMHFPLTINTKDNTTINNVWPVIEQWSARCIKGAITHKSHKYTVRVSPLIFMGHYTENITQICFIQDVELPHLHLCSVWPHLILYYIYYVVNRICCIFYQWHLCKVPDIHKLMP